MSARWADLLKFCVWPFASGINIPLTLLYFAGGINIPITIFCFVSGSNIPTYKFLGLGLFFRR